MIPADARCGNCQHWQDPHKFLTSVPDVRECYAVEHHDPDSHPPADAAAFVVDGSGYFAALRTREDFACSLFRALR